MKRVIAGIALIGVLALTGCGNYGKPTDQKGIEDFKQFSKSCTEAGGRLEEGPKNWYTCDMGGS